MPGIGGTAGSGASTILSAAGSAATKTAGAAAFQAQLADLAAVSAEATARSMQLRTLTTELSTIKKAADERAT